MPAGMLTFEEAKRAKELFLTISSQRKLAKILGVSTRLVSDLVHGFTYKDVPWPNGRTGGYEEAYGMPMEVMNRRSKFSNKLTTNMSPEAPKGFGVGYKPLGFGELPKGTRMLDGSISGHQPPAKSMTPIEEIASMDPHGPDAQAVAILMQKDGRESVDQIWKIVRDTKTNAIKRLVYHDELEEALTSAREDIQKRKDEEHKKLMADIHKSIDAFDAEKDAEEQKALQERLNPWNANYKSWDECLSLLGKDHEIVQAFDGHEKEVFLKRAVGIMMVSIAPDMFSSEPVLLAMQRLAQELEAHGNGSSDA